jgi:hypothetical protein
MCLRHITRQPPGIFGSERCLGHLRVSAQSGKALIQRAVHVLARWVEVAEVEHRGIYVVVVLAPEVAVGGAFDRGPPIVPAPDVEGNAVA